MCSSCSNTCIHFRLLQMRTEALSCVFHRCVPTSASCDGSPGQMTWNITQSTRQTASFSTSSTSPQTRSPRWVREWPWIGSYRTSVPGPMRTSGAATRAARAVSGKPPLWKASSAPVSLPRTQPISWKGARSAQVRAAPTIVAAALVALLCCLLFSVLHKSLKIFKIFRSVACVQDNSLGMTSEYPCRDLAR